jgi:translation initiation factor IF-2
VPISAATGQGIKELTEVLWQKIQALKAAAQPPTPVRLPGQA